VCSLSYWCSLSLFLFLSPSIVVSLALIFTSISLSLSRSFLCFFSCPSSLVSRLEFRCQSWTVHLADRWAGRGVCAQVAREYALDEPADHWSGLHKAICAREVETAEWWVDWMSEAMVQGVSPNDRDHPICNTSRDTALVALVIGAVWGCSCRCTR
jgi:hypothetical protein